jgi:hypothetical protein
MVDRDAMCKLKARDWKLLEERQRLRDSVGERLRVAAIHLEISPGVVDRPTA